MTINEPKKISINEPKKMTINEPKKWSKTGQNCTTSINIYIYNKLIKLNF